jgi:hypothetical protein
MVDIQNVKQRNEESVSDYATRMRMAAGPLMPERPPDVVIIQPFEGAQQMVQNPMHPEMMIAYESKLAYTSRLLCTYFLQGLLKTILQHMRGRAYSTFDECIDDAMEAESFMIQSNSITYSINAIKLDEKDVAEADVNRIQRNSGTGLKVSGKFTGTGIFDGKCHFCKRKGHRVRECPTRNKYGEKAFTEIAKNQYREKQKNRYKRFRDDETRSRKKSSKKDRSRKDKKKEKKGGKKRKSKSKRVHAVQLDSDGEEEVTSSSTSDDSSEMDSSSSSSSSSDSESEAEESQPKNA